MKTNTSVIAGKMTQLPKASDLVKAVPLPELQKWGTGEGEIVNPFDLSFTWKVKGADTGFVFAVYEMTIKPNAKIPLITFLDAPEAENAHCDKMGPVKNCD